MQHIQKLALVLMQTLNLNVENAVGVNLNMVMLFDILRKGNLILPLDFLECLAEIGFVGKWEQLFKLLCFLYPFVADF